ncbi:hypothetical protein NKH71_06280 [Mesorhizobium sp. M0983]|uniref:hypothetical protein n=1 Tax=Mesorhizobium sp. M0983 TaxID=2957040 RepID=UPI003335D45F
MSQRMFGMAFQNWQVERPREKGPSIYDVVSAEIGNRFQMKPWPRPWEDQCQALMQLCEKHIEANHWPPAIECLWAAINICNDAGRKGLVPGWVEPPPA